MSKNNRNVFTITVIMKAFFADSRSQAKIFINENIKTVLDLENKISSIFGIKNFHLISNDMLLPTCEDIRLLENGDSVCVVPNDSRQQILLLDESFYCTSNENTECKKKKRRSLKDECPTKEKKCKKKRKETLSSNDEEIQEPCETKLSKKSKKVVLNNSEKKNDKNEINKNIFNPGKLILNKYEYLKPEVNNFCTSTPNDNELKTGSDVFAFQTNAIVHADVAQKYDNVQSHQQAEGRKKKQHNTVIENSCGKNEKSKTNSKSVLESVSEQNGETAERKKLESNYETGGRSSQTGNILNVAKEKIMEECAKALKDSINSKSDVCKNESKVERMIVDSSSSSSSESGTIDEKVQKQNNVNFQNNSEVKTDVNRRSTTCSDSNAERKNEDQHSKVITSNQSKIKTSAEKSSSSSSSDSEELQARDPLKNHLQAKKRPTLWSTSLLKATNHVKINKIPLEEVKIDYSKFVFKPCDIGVIPIPNTSKVEMNESNQISDKNALGDGTCNRKAFVFKTNKESLNSDFSSNSCQKNENTSIPKCFQKSDCVAIKESKFKNFPEPVACIEQIREEPVSTVASNSCNQNEEKLEKTPLSPKSSIAVGIRDYTCLLPSPNRQCNSQCIQNESNVPTKNEIDRKIWRQNVLEKVSHNSVCDQENSENGTIKNNEIIESNKTNAESVGNASPVSSKVTKLSVNSNNIKKRISKEMSVTYYMKLLNKIDWDVMKSISNVDVSDLSAETAEKPKEDVEEGMENCENVDSNSVSSVGTDFVTKRKRKRKHKKKVRVATPVPMQNWGKPTALRKLPVITGTPKVHIRFENAEKDSTPANVGTPNCGNPDDEQTFANNEKIKILQDVSLDLSIQSNKNIHSNSSNIINVSDTVNNHSTAPYNLNPNFKVTAESACSTMNMSDNNSMNANTSNVLLHRKCNSNSVEAHNNQNKTPDQKIALNYTNENLCFNESNDFSRMSDWSRNNLLDTSRADSLESAKSSLLKALDFLRSEESKNNVENITLESCCKDLSIDNICKVSEFSIKNVDDLVNT